MEHIPPSRFGDWNAHNRTLLEETQRLGGNKYREIYKQLTQKHMNEEEIKHIHKMTSILNILYYFAGTIVGFLIAMSLLS